MTESEIKVEDELLTQAVSQLSYADLWSSERKQTLFAVSPSLIERPWIVEMELDRRRYVEARKRMVSWVQEDPLRATFRKDTYDELSAHISNVTKLLAEYDHMKWSPDGVLADVDTTGMEWYDDPTPEQREALDRLWKISAVLNEQGVDVAVRDNVIDLLTEFEVAFRFFQMSPGPLDSADCIILKPAATYLGRPELQSSFLSRYFAICFLKCLRDEAGQVARASSTLRDANASRILTRFADAIGRLGRRARPSEAYGREPKLELNASGILTGLLAQFGDLGNLASPSTVDGRELKPALREVQRVGVRVPSLLFSLFEIIQPGR